MDRTYVKVGETYDVKVLSITITNVTQKLPRLVKYN
jgi:hypothetical protein